MNPYHKIKTVWERDPDNKFKTLIEGKWSAPEFKYLADLSWVFTEKVDGTNIRLSIGEVNVIGGRTDNAQIPTFLLKTLNDIGDKAKTTDLPLMTLYGEGYGARIQKGGGNYISDGVDFVLFDVRCGNVWLERENVQDIAGKLDIKVVPIIGVGTLNEAIRITREGFNSTWGPFPAEGLVMRPTIELLDRQSKRIIGKIKTKDF